MVSAFSSLEVGLQPSSANVPPTNLQSLVENYGGGTGEQQVRRSLGRGRRKWLWERTGVQRKSGGGRVRVAGEWRTGGGERNGLGAGGGAAGLAARELCCAAVGGPDQFSEQ